MRTFQPFFMFLTKTILTTFVLVFKAFTNWTLLRDRFRFHASKTCKNVFRNIKKNTKTHPIYVYVYVYRSQFGLFYFESRNFNGCKIRDWECYGGIGVCSSDWGRVCGEGGSECWASSSSTTGRFSCGSCQSPGGRLHCLVNCFHDQSSLCRRIIFGKSFSSR